MRNLLVSFSGGRTSAYMSALIKAGLAKQYDQVLYIFANSTREHPKTLEFVDRVDKEFNLGVIWVEASVRQGRKGTTYKVVDYSTAKTDGSVFEEVIKKYGIPNASYPHCTRELKLNPIHKYAKDFFGGEDYDTAIGIRTDESRRVSKTATTMNIVYPLIDWLPSDKQDVNDFWEDQAFNLEIPEHYGNCITCWKKSNRKLFTIMDEHNEWFDFERKMEKLYADAGAGTGGRVFFRGGRSVKDLELLKNEAGFDKFVDSRFTDIHENSGCSESCELYETEDMFK